MNTEENNLVRYALIGTGALAAVGLVYYAVSNRREVTYDSAKLLKEVDDLGSVQKDQSGSLAFEYYKDIFIIISKHAR